MTDFWSVFVFSAVTIFVIMDPFPSIIPFLKATQKAPETVCVKSAIKVVVLAGVIAYFFLFSGTWILNLLNIGLQDFKIAGGIILTLLGIETVLGIEFVKQEKKSENMENALILVATPLLTGPGLASTLILLASAHETVVVGLALAVALLGTLITLLLSVKLKKLFGDQGLKVIAKLFGLILLAMGVNYIRMGIMGG